MRIDRILIYDISLPMRIPWTVHGRTIDVRESIIVQVITEEGLVGFGEAAPLPGLSPELLKKARYQLERLAEDWRGREVPLKGPELVNYCEMALNCSLVCCSAKFALESAILMAASRARDTLPCNILRPGSARAVQSVGLLSGTLNEVIEQAKEQKLKGLSVFKLKVGSRNIPLDIRKVEEVKAVLGSSARLRLDANRNWRFDEALLFAQHIGKNQVEFLEEPCVPLQKWEELYRRTNIPLAADESLLQNEIHDLVGLNGLSYFVVKPTVWGGVAGFCRLQEELKEYSQKLIVSSALESGIGATMLANLATLTDEMAGLAPLQWLAEDSLQRPLLVPGGMIPVQNLIFTSEDLCDTLRNQLVLY